MERARPRNTMARQTPKRLHMSRINQPAAIALTRSLALAKTTCSLAEFAIRMLARVQRAKSDDHKHSDGARQGGNLG